MTSFLYGLMILVSASALAVADRHEIAVEMLRKDLAIFTKKLSRSVTVYHYADFNEFKLESGKSYPVDSQEALNHGEEWRKSFFKFYENESGMMGFGLYAATNSTSSASYGGANWGALEITLPAGSLIYDNRYAGYSSSFFLDPATYYLLKEYCGLGNLGEAPGPLYVASKSDFNRNCHSVMVEAFRRSGISAILYEWQNYNHICANGTAVQAAFIFVNFEINQSNTSFYSYVDQNRQFQKKNAFGCGEGKEDAQPTFELVSGIYQKAVRVNTKQFMDKKLDALMIHDIFREQYDKHDKNLMQFKAKKEFSVTEEVRIGGHHFKILTKDENELYEHCQKVQDGFNKGAIGELASMPFIEILNPKTGKGINVAPVYYCEELNRKIKEDKVDNLERITWGKGKYQFNVSFGNYKTKFRFDDEEDLEKTCEWVVERIKIYDLDEINVSAKDFEFLRSNSSSYWDTDEACKIVEEARLTFMDNFDRLRILTEAKERHETLKKNKAKGFVVITGKIENYPFYLTGFSTQELKKTCELQVKPMYAAKDLDELTMSVNGSEEMSLQQGGNYWDIKEACQAIIDQAVSYFANMRMGQYKEKVDSLIKFPSSSAYRISGEVYELPFFWEFKDAASFDAGCAETIGHLQKVGLKAFERIEYRYEKLEESLYNSESWWKPSDFCPQIRKSINKVWKVQRLKREYDAAYARHAGTGIVGTINDVEIAFAKNTRVQIIRDCEKRLKDAAPESRFDRIVIVNGRDSYNFSDFWSRKEACEELASFYFSK